MNKKLGDVSSSGQISEDGVREYLRSQPKFLVENPDILWKLEVPHEAGKGAVSLIERQVQLMRHRIDDQEMKLEQSRHEASYYRHLVENIRRLILELMESDSPKVLYQKLIHGLLDDYRADEIRLYIFTSYACPSDFSGIRFMKDNDKIKYLFSGVFNHHRPLCGSLQDEHVRALFGNDTELVHSTVLVPLKQLRWEGLLALGSRQWNYYCHGVSLELLVLVSDVVSKVISGWLEEKIGQDTDENIK